MSSKPTYSILLPTYNERENLPIIVWLIIKYMDERFVAIIILLTKILIKSLKYLVVLITR